MSFPPCYPLDFQHNHETKHHPEKFWNRRLVVSELHVHTYFEMYGSRIGVLNWACAGTLFWGIPTVQHKNTITAEAHDIEQKASDMQHKVPEHSRMFHVTVVIVVVIVIVVIVAVG